MTDSVLIHKIMVLVMFFVGTMLCGLLPLILVRLARSWTKRFEAGSASKLLAGARRHGDLLVSCVMCLGAGVLLATIFTHMVPEVREAFVEIEEAGLFPDIGLPPGELFLCAGFFLVYFIEEVAHTFMAHGRKRKLHRRAAAVAAEAGDKAAVAEESTETSDEHEHAGHAGHAGHDHAADIASQHAFRAYLIVIALSVHSVFEGFAAAFEDSAREVWVFFAAIMAHKTIVAFCIGEQLLNAKRSTCFIVSNLSIFALATPLGVLLGLVVAGPSQEGGGSLLAAGILQGLAAGTILYVIFFELLGPEQRKPGPGLLKFFVVLVGFALMLIVQSSAGHSHEHGGHSHAVGGHGPHAGHGDPHGHQGHDHGDHGDHHGAVAKRVENAIHAHDHGHNEGHSDHSEHHAHDNHSDESPHSGHEGRKDHGHDHAHDHAHDQDHDHAHAKGADIEYDVNGSEVDGSVAVKPIPDRDSVMSANGSRTEKETHHFHADGHNHLGPASDGHASTGDGAGHGAEAGHDHSDHAGHDHSDHTSPGAEASSGHSDHSDHTGHDHSDHNSPAAEASPDHSDHIDHTGHDHSDHAGHDHANHAGHDHASHSAPRPHMPRDSGDQGADMHHGHLDHGTARAPTAETAGRKNREEMMAVSEPPEVNRTGRKSADGGAPGHGHTADGMDGHELSPEGSGLADQFDTAGGEAAVAHVHE